MVNYNALAVGIILFALTGCKPNATSDLEAITGLDKGENVAMGLLPVHHHFEKVSFGAWSNDPGVRSIQKMSTMPYLALVQCYPDGTMVAEDVLLRAEKLAVGGALLLSVGEQSGKRSLGFKDGDKPFQNIRCAVVGKRLASWPVLAATSLLIATFPETAPPDQTSLENIGKTYALAQAIYLALRGSTNMNALDPEVGFTVMPKIAQMASLHEGIEAATTAKRADGMRNNIKIWDPVFNPCRDPINAWYATKWRNALYHCTPVAGHAELRNYKAGNNGEEFIGIRNLIGGEIDELHTKLYANVSTFKSPMAKAAWDIFTTTTALQENSSNNFANKLLQVEQLAAIEGSRAPNSKTFALGPTLDTGEVASSSEAVPPIAAPPAAGGQAQATPPSSYVQMSQLPEMPTADKFTKPYGSYTQGGNKVMRGPEPFNYNGQLMQFEMHEGPDKKQVFKAVNLPSDYSTKPGYTPPAGFKMYETNVQVGEDGRVQFMDYPKIFMPSAPAQTTAPALPPVAVPDNAPPVVLFNMKEPIFSTQPISNNPRPQLRQDATTDAPATQATPTLPTATGDSIQQPSTWPSAKQPSTWQSAQQLGIRLATWPIYGPMEAFNQGAKAITTFAQPNLWSQSPTITPGTRTAVPKQQSGTGFYNSMGQAALQSFNRLNPYGYLFGWQ